MKLQQDPLSMTKPDNLPNMDIIKDKAIAKISSGIPGANKMPGDMFTPSFVKPTISNRVIVLLNLLTMFVNTGIIYTAKLRILSK